MHKVATTIKEREREKHSITLYKKYEVLSKVHDNLCIHI